MGQRSGADCADGIGKRGWIQQIAIASEEQSTATQQIAADIENVAEVTKESAAGINESCKACQDMSHMANELHRLVGNFRISKTGRLPAET